MQSEVTLLFNQAICDAIGEREGRDEIIRFIALHERKNVCVLNLCHQIETAESRFGARLGVKRRNYLISECAKMFVAAALQSWKVQAMSLAEKSRILNRDAKYDEIKSCIKERDPDGSIKPIDSENEGAAGGSP